MADPSYAYEQLPRRLYGAAQFIPICETCGRFVRADETIQVTAEGLSTADNATCAKCGRTHMIFEGFMG